MEIKDVSNPVGTSKSDENIENYLQIIAAKWDAANVSAPWWKFWSKISFTKVVNFLITALDDLIAYVDDVVDNNADKKATVLAAMGRLYDYVIKQAMPIWLVPVAGVLRTLVLDHVMAVAIDWMVDKYRNGEWRKKVGKELAEEWSTVKTQMFIPGNIIPRV